jgi:2-polyprenyl-3-methyl-5-hydroxy-6-metoxy-1,4-benzoquinol methylase
MPMCGRSNIATLRLSRMRPNAVGSTPREVRSSSGTEWHEQPPPSDLHAIIRKLFKPGRVADIGCGSGLEVAWLAANGYSAIGYDPSEGLLEEARRRYPQLDFRTAALPELSGAPPASFDNVLCETVLMHLDRTVIAPSVRRLVTILRPGGTLYLSWRVSKSDKRDQHGRLYAAFDKGLVNAALAEESILMEEEVVSASSGKVIHRIVARRNSA